MIGKTTWSRHRIYHLIYHLKTLLMIDLVWVKLEVKGVWDVLVVDVVMD
jgi:hypothetical protein